MTEASLIAYMDSTDDESITLADAWDDFADAYGWDREDNPYRHTPSHPPYFDGHDRGRMSEEIPYR